MLAASVSIHHEIGSGGLPGRAILAADPDGTERIAAELLDDPRVLTARRGLLAVVGAYDGVPVLVQTTGIGGPSTAIVVHELIARGVRLLVRTGSAGGLGDHVAVGDVVVAEAVVGADGVGKDLAGWEPRPGDPELLAALRVAAAAETRVVHVGSIVSTDHFHEPPRGEGRVGRWAAAGRLAVDMEAAALFGLADRAGARAGCVLGVTRILTGGRDWLEPASTGDLDMEVARIGLRAVTGVWDATERRATS